MHKHVMEYFKDQFLETNHLKPGHLIDSILLHHHVKYNEKIAKSRSKMLELCDNFMNSENVESKFENDLTYEIQISDDIYFLDNLNELTGYTYNKISHSLTDYINAIYDSESCGKRITIDCLKQLANTYIIRIKIKDIL